MMQRRFHHRSSWSSPVIAACLAGTGTALVPLAVSAIDTATLELGRIEGDGWEARNVAVTLSLADLPAGPRGARLTADSLRIEGISEPLQGVTVDCPGFTLDGRRIRCPRARIDAQLPGLGVQHLTASLIYEPGSGALELQMEGIAVGGGTAAMQVALRDDAWTVQSRLREVDTAALLELAQAWAIPLPEITATGALTLDLSAQGAGTVPAVAEFEARMTDLTAANAQGTLASDRLMLALAGKVEHQGDHWSFTVDVESAAGQAYAEPVFLDFGAHALKAGAAGHWQDGTLQLTRFALDHRDVLTAHGSAVLVPAGETPLQKADVVLETLRFPGAYASYLQPFLLATSFKSLETAGALSGRLSLDDGTPQSLELAIENVSADDGTGQLALYGLNGLVHWGGDDMPAGDSRLSWEGGLLFGLDVGAVTLDFRTRQRDFELLGATRIPLLDGAIELDRFQIQAAGTPAMAFALDANVLPISVQRLSRAFGWPEFGGQLAGRISDLRLDGGVLTLATTLRAQVFDGRLEISDLKIEDPFGNWPRLYSSIDIYNLDLQQVTSAFSFGLITGRLSGYINEIVLFDWMPVEFDLRLYTPPEDRSRHRISQRAVQNIGNLGGGGAGVGAALSSGFMRFFDEFNYDSLGISCRLENEVCLMDGVEPAPNGGYYLVKGRGIPRIDVIGNAGRVDWPRLVAQLAAIAESGGPVVE